jgi:DNA-directed RNA polymerase subunit M/transcription elongation factor TFIIS
MNRAPKPPPCPKCRRIDRAEEEEQTGSSARWFTCTHCGFRYREPSVGRL